MDAGLLYFLLGYPLSIFANIHTRYFQKKLSDPEVDDLKKLFINATISALESNKRGVDRLGKQTINQVSGEISKDSAKLLAIIESCTDNDIFSVGKFNRTEFKERLVESISREYNFQQKSLATAVVDDCLEKYEASFFSNMTETSGIQFLAKGLQKINSTVAKKNDIDNLKTIIIEELNKHNQAYHTNKTLPSLVLEELSNPVSADLSNSIVDYMSSIRKKVDKLTTDQHQIIHYLRYEKRVMISGCAGSGKTILAAEKAIRLDRAGIKTLILCHNPLLALYIKELTSGSSVHVCDITSLVNNLNGRTGLASINWHKYSEPLEVDIESAFDRVGVGGFDYEAIIVDEAQDFRELWWLLIDALLEQSINKILYIFYDDNQSLLPFRSKYPITNSPISMSRNCRNAGSIFEIVKKFHPNSPLISQFLASDGIAKITTFKDCDLTTSLSNALQEATQYATQENISIVTNENEIARSAISEFEYSTDIDLDWRKFILADLQNAKVRFINRIKRLSSSSSISEIENRFSLPRGVDIRKYLRLPNLSNKPYPTEKDRIAVKEFATKLLPTIEAGYAKGAKFERYGTKLRVTEQKPTNPNAKIRARLNSRIYFYSRDNWIKTLPQAMSTTKIVPFSKHFSDENTLPLYSINMFKGLESEAIILFINSINRDLKMELYVGSSRAIGYLHIVINRAVLSKIRHLL